MTGGAGNTFAIIPGTITKPGDDRDHPFTIDPAHFTLPKQALRWASTSCRRRGRPQAADRLGRRSARRRSSRRRSTRSTTPTCRTWRSPRGRAPAPSSRRWSRSSRTTRTGRSPTPSTSRRRGRPAATSCSASTCPATPTATAPSTRPTSRSSRRSVQVHARQPELQLRRRRQPRRSDRPIDLAFTLQNLGVSTNITPVVTANLDPRRPSRQPAEGHQPPDRPLHRHGHARRDDHLHRHQQHVEPARR